MTSSRPSSTRANHDASEGEALALTSDSPEATRRLGARLSELLQPGDILLLEGDLGMGKTALTQGIGAGLGVHGVINSPTFTLLKEYTGRLPLYHFDLYRIEAPDEVAGLGFEDYFGGEGVAVVEWADRIPAESEAPWPDDYLGVAFQRAGPERRHLTFSARGMRGRALLAAVASHATEWDGSAQPGEGMAHAPRD